MDGLVDGYVVSSFNKSTGDLEKISAGTDFKTTGPFIGKYSLGKLTGPIWMSSLGGGWIHGVVDEDQRRKQEFKGFFSLDIEVFS